MIGRGSADLGVWQAVLCFLGGGQSYAATRGDEEEAQGNKVYYTHRS